MSAERHRVRVGVYAYQWVLTTVVLLGAAALWIVAPLAQGTHYALVGFGILTLGLALSTVPLTITALRPVIVRPGRDGTLSIPVFGWRRGFGRVTWPLTEVRGARLTAVRGRYDAHYRARFSGPGGEVTSDSVTCLRRRRHPERTRAGRALDAIEGLVLDAHRAPP